MFVYLQPVLRTLTLLNTVSRMREFVGGALTHITRLRKAASQLLTVSAEMDIGLRGL